jgi:hypothetical protein
VFCSVGALVVMHLLPEAWHRVGPLALGAFLFGFLLPWVGHRGDGRRSLGRTAHAWVVVGLLLHALVDGAALRAGAEGPGMALAVILHRLPVGLFVWWVVRAAAGEVAARWLLAGLVGATMAGFFGGAFRDPVALGLLNAVVAGSVAHVVFEPRSWEPTPRSPAPRHGRLVGAVLGLALVTPVVLGDGGLVPRLQWLFVPVGAALLVGAAVRNQGLVPGKGPRLI